MNLNENLYRTRRLKNAFAMVLSSGAALIGLGWLVWILLTTLIKGGSALSLDLFTEMTPPPGAEGARGVPRRHVAIGVLQELSNPTTLAVKHREAVSVAGGQVVPAAGCRVGGGEQRESAD